MQPTEIRSLRLSWSHMDSAAEIYLSVASFLRDDCKIAETLDYNLNHFRSVLVLYGLKLLIGNRNL